MTSKQFRTEHDSMGELQVPADAMWGATTQRAVENFPITGIRIAHFTDVHITEDPRRVPRRALFSKRLLGWGNLRFGGRFEAFRNARAVARAFVADLEEVEPDAVVFTGDVTALALDSELEAARARLENERR